MAIDYSDRSTINCVERLVNVACGVSKILMDMGISEGEGAQGHAEKCAAESLDLLGTALFDATRFYFEGADNE